MVKRWSPNLASSLHPVILILAAAVVAAVVVAAAVVAVAPVVLVLEIVDRDGWKSFRLDFFPGVLWWWRVFLTPGT